MSSSDVPISAGGVKAAPLDYVIPGSAEIQPLAVYAEFDGSGAAGNYKPALTLISTAGRKQWIAQTDETVTAGDNARVSWAPGFRGAPTTATATAGTAVATVWGKFGAPAQTIAAGVNAVVTYDATTFSTTDASVFSFDSVGNIITGSVPGFYRAWHYVDTAVNDLNFPNFDASLFMQDSLGGNSQEPIGGAQGLRYTNVPPQIAATMCHSYALVQSGLNSSARLANFEAAGIILSNRIFCVELAIQVAAGDFNSLPSFP